jgi:hypothetical protein
MRIETRRDETRMTRTLVYGVNGVGKVEHPDYYTIHGETVSVELDREEDRSPWQLYWVTLFGRRYIANGKKLGESTAQHVYTRHGVDNDPHMPSWLLTLADKALRVAEADRLGYTPPCPKCCKPSTLADPLNPNQSGEFCEPCAFRFDAGNGLRRIPGVYAVSPGGSQAGR